jgi:hypothetical protein
MWIGTLAKLHLGTKITPLHQTGDIFGEKPLINEVLLQKYDREIAVTRTTLERCPEEKFGWKPQPKSFAMAALATHIAKASDQHLMQTWTLLARWRWRAAGATGRVSAAQRHPRAGDLRPLGG